MYRIISNAEAAAAIGAKCGGQQPSDEDTALSSAIIKILPKLEAVCNVKSLARASWEDQFQFFSAVASATLRLDNGFLDPEVDVAVTGPDGVVITVDPDDIDYETGTVMLSDVTVGRYKVTYTAGFLPKPYETDPVPNPAPLDYTNPLLLAVPEWMRTAAIAYLVHWFRVEVLAPRLPTKVADGPAVLVDAINKEIQARAYSTYMRPRAGVVWTQKSTKV